MQVPLLTSDQIVSFNLKKLNSMRIYCCDDLIFSVVKNFSIVGSFLLRGSLFFLSQPVRRRIEHEISFAIAFFGFLYVAN